MNALHALLSAPVLATAPLLDPVPAPGDVKPGWWATLLVLGLIAATVLLWFSMRKQLRRIRFPDDSDANGEAGTTGATSTTDMDRDPAETENDSGSR
jgi:hypothetical protein